MTISSPQILTRESWSPCAEILEKEPGTRSFKRSLLQGVEGKPQPVPSSRSYFELPPRHDLPCLLRDSFRP